MANEEDARLAARILARDPGAPDELIASLRPFIFAILTRRGNLTREDAEDVFQQFLLRVWEDDFRRLRQWRGTTSLASYLAAIARNLARDYRRRAREQIRADRREQPQPRRALPQEMTIAVRDALAALPERDRTLLYRRYYLGETYRELGAALGMTPNHAGVALSRAEKRFRRMLKK